MRASCVVAVVLLGSCGGAGPRPAAPAPASSTAAAAPVAAVPAPAAPPAPVAGPVGERASQLRRAADILELAQTLLAKGARDDAEIQFSTAELITGPEAVAALAPRFREGAPPRVTTPVVKVDPDAPAQPATVGSSDDEDDEDARATPTPAPVKKPAERGALTGTVKIAGGVSGLAMITLEPIGRRWTARKPKQRVMEQRGRQFAPRLMLIPVGSTVAFPNLDPIFHNVFSTSQPSPFDLGLFKLGEARTNTFDREGILHIGCNIHANMSATIVVVGAPHYVIAGADGSFAFRSLAPGRYTLRAWSDRSKAPITQEVTIKPGANSVEVGVDGDAPTGPSPDKFGVARAAS